MLAQAPPDMDSDPTGWAPWSLTDARPRGRGSSGLATPLTTWPQLSKLQAGDRVGLVFLFLGHDHHGPFLQNELVWLTVRTQFEGALLASVDAPPSHSALLRAGDVVSFELHHVAALSGLPYPEMQPRHRPRRQDRSSWRRLLRLDP